MTPTTSLRSTLAPTGRLRACINLGNPILARPGPDSSAQGVSVDLAIEFARMLDVELQLVVVDTASQSVDIVASDAADIGFFAVDPARGEKIAFTAPYLLIEGSYLVADGSPIRANDEVDRAGHRVVVGKGSAYDLFLTRTLKHAEIVRAPASPAVVDTFLEQGADVAAGVRQQLEADMRRLQGLRLLHGRFMVIRQAMGMPRSRGEEAAALLASFVERMKDTGFVAAALMRHGITDVAVAPAAG